ncbi:hypothetical protein IFR05_010560 [Cadophora sp. M221]|nr:hypothetical protein IFR05_010560 [Cadophora sp. M221]
MIKQILGGQRVSSMKPGSLHAFRETLGKMRKRNEATVAERLIAFSHQKGTDGVNAAYPLSCQNLSQGTCRYAQKGARYREPYRGIEDEPEPDLVSGKEIDSATRRAFELDHLDWSIDKDFSRNCVPTPDAFAERSPSELGIKNPNPDITYGFEPTAFTEEEQLDLNIFEHEFSAGIISPFFVIQWKGFAGSLERAKEQARRDGAAMVRARRKAMKKITPIDEGEPNDKLDWDTMAFTLNLFSSPSSNSFASVSYLRRFFFQVLVLSGFTAPLWLFIIAVCLSTTSCKSSHILLAGMMISSSSIC